MVKWNYADIVLCIIVAAGLVIASVIVLAIINQSSPTEKQCVENSTSFVCVERDGSYTIQEK